MNLLERDAKCLWHPFTKFPAPGPRVELVAAQGAYVFDSQGKSYLDGTSSWWCQIHGHCHPKLVQALIRQAARMDQVLFAPHTHAPAVSLAEALLKILGLKEGRVFFSDDGSTAVETALKMSLQYWMIKNEPQRRKFLALEGAYHGDTLGAVAVNGVSEFHDRFSFVGSHTLRVSLPVNWEEVERLLGAEGNQCAALILEPLLLGAAGMKFVPAATVERLVDLARRYGMLVIFDEVLTGFGRTGTLFAQDQLAVRPDVTCLSKGLTSGVLPLGATVVHNKYYATFETARSTFFHGHTFTANPISCAVAKASLDLFEEGQTLSKVENISAFFGGQRKRFAGLSHLKNVRSQGPIFAFDSELDGWQVATRLWDRGIWIRPLGNVLYVMPPYCISEVELSQLMDALYEEVSR